LNFAFLAVLSSFLAFSNFVFVLTSYNYKLFNLEDLLTSQVFDKYFLLFSIFPLLCCFDHFSIGYAFHLLSFCVSKKIHLSQYLFVISLVVLSVCLSVCHFYSIGLFICLSSVFLLRFFALDIPLESAA